MNGLKFMIKHELFLLKMYTIKRKTMKNRIR